MSARCPTGSIRSRCSRSCYWSCCRPSWRRKRRASLLSTLAGIALTFISLGFLFRTYARPVVGLTTLGVILLVYFGRVRFRGGIPGGVVAVALGAPLVRRAWRAARVN